MVQYVHGDDAKRSLAAKKKHIRFRLLAGFAVVISRRLKDKLGEYADLKIVFCVSINKFMQKIMLSRKAHIIYLHRRNVGARKT